MGFILFLIAQIVTPIFNIFGMIYACFRFKSWKEANLFYLNVAISKDQHSNVTLQYFFNDILIKKGSEHKYGNVDETISSVFGKNQKSETLTVFGKFWNRFLNKLDNNHSIDAIEEDEIIK